MKSQSATPASPSAADWRRHLPAGTDPLAVASGLGRGTLVGAARAAARRHPGREAVRVGDAALTHGELDDRAGRVAAWLRRHGAAPGRRLLLAGGNSLDYVVAYLAGLRSGAAVAMVNPSLTPHELGLLVEDADPVVAVASPARAGELADLGLDVPVLHLDEGGAGSVAAVAAGGEPDRGPDPAPADVAHLAFTSGTTGRAKPTPLTHGNVLASIEAAALAWRWRSDDVLIHALPLQHAHGLTGVHAALLHGSRTAVLAAFDPEELCRAVAALPATVLFGVPTVYERLLGWDGPGRAALRGLRLATSGSAPLSPRTSDALVELLGQRPVERYGCTETGYLTSNPLEGERRPGSVGFALPGVELRVVDEAARDVAPGDDGEVVARGPQVFGGYLTGGDDATFLPGGWFRTGDIGRVDPASGHLGLTGRAKEVIISGGLNVYPREVELVLEASPSVAEAAVVGVPSARWGEEVVAFVVPRAGATLDVAAVAVEAAAKLAPYKRPKRIDVVDALPRNALGKVVRRALVDGATPGA